MTTTQALAEHVHGLRAQNIPDAVLDLATVAVVDTIGAGLHGSRTKVGDLVFGSVAGCRGPAPAWGRSTALDPAAAALVNGTQSHAYELDDYHPGAKCHPGAVVITAAFAAAAERPPSGIDLLRAVVAGYEVMIRVSLAAGSNSTRRRGWHLTGLVGPFGAATAAALVWEMDLAELLHALGIAGSHAGGLFAFSSSGAMTKRLHAGLAAESGIRSARLARDGLTGPVDVLEADDGGFLRAVSDDADPRRLTADLLDPFVIEEVAIKPYSACGSLHSSIDAVIRLVEAHDLHADDIDAITAHNASVVAQQCAFPFRGQGGVLEAQMSVQYCLAVAAIDRAAFLPQFTDDRLSDDAVLALARRVTLRVDPDIDTVYPTRMPARVTIDTTSGERHEGYVPAPTGSPSHPLGMDGVLSKLEQVTTGVGDPRRVAELIDVVQDLRSVDDVGVLTHLLTS